jgi:hypothetical protein
VRTAVTRKPRIQFEQAARRGRHGAMLVRHLRPDGNPSAGGDTAGVDYGVLAGLRVQLENGLLAPMTSRPLRQRCRTL